MGRIPEADAELARIKICLKCKARNSINAVRCRKCGYTRFRKKETTVKAKK
ncbi:MAG: 50S ribosomal protein L40e [Candidatus Micrarchaeota archaeon]|nr:50S ribosomal protein L40e [Candidatus Micrarchaeota archaeon]